MKARLERHALTLWYRTARPAWPWRCLSRLHERLLRSRWPRPVAQPPVPVIVVGNLTAGGSGKTPMVIALGRALAAGPRPVAVICRGVGGRALRQPRRVVANDDVSEVGDEAVLLAEQTGLPVWVGRERGRALAAAIADGAELVISDDGLQHRALPRSFEICMVDGVRGFGNGYLLPAGPLRQPLARLDSVDLLVTKGDQPCRPGSLVWPLRAARLVRLDGGEQRPLDSFRGQPVVALCAIANPERFADELAEQGMQVALRAFPDHHRFTAADLAAVPGPLLVTAKDAVKLRGLGRETETWVVEQSLALPKAVLEPVLAHLRCWQAGRQPDDHSQDCH